MHRALYPKPKTGIGLGLDRVEVRFLLGWHHHTTLATAANPSGLDTLPVHLRKSRGLTLSAIARKCDAQRTIDRNLSSGAASPASPSAFFIDHPAEGPESR
ncbi:hypothetical protein AZG88_37780 [Rhodococcus sp. LB1]|nr:hypothetical protein AZG88_37780 [Rhodococcus sp. LB1]